jgi:hypothetical protein
MWGLFVSVASTAGLMYGLYQAVDYINNALGFG